MSQTALRRNGFTIVELLIVVVVIAILAAITVVAYNGVTGSATQSAMKQELSTSAKKLLIYKETNSTYPANFEDSGGKTSSSYIRGYKRTTASFCVSLTKDRFAFYITHEGTIGVGDCASALTFEFALGYNHSLALASDGAVYAWGGNNQSQLGDGTTTSQSTPLVITDAGSLAGKTVTQLVAGMYYTIALASDGTIHSWGYNHHGMLGDGTTTQRSTPAAIVNTGSLAGKTVTRLVSGSAHIFALASDGTVHAWGGNAFGQLGEGTTTSRYTPVVTANTGSLAGKTVTQLVAGGTYMLALASDGTVHSWGGNSYGQLGDGTTIGKKTPIAITNAGSLAGKVVVQLAAGSEQASALASDGTVHTWGRNNFGQLGDGTQSNRYAPVNITNNGTLASKTVTQVAVGAWHMLALASDNTVHAWGGNHYGQLGDNTVVDTRSSPVSMTAKGTLAGKTVKKLIAGDVSSFITASDNTVHAWGGNAWGELGVSTVTNLKNYTPALITFP